MYKVVAHIVRNPQLTSEEFKSFWENVHVPLIKASLPNLKRYTGNFVEHVPGVVDEDIRLTDFDLIVELGFSDKASMIADMTGSSFWDEERMKSSAKLMDMPKGRAVVVFEIDVS